MEAQISKSFIKIKERNSLYEICPVLPFPSKDPRRSDAIVFQYHQLLFDSLQVESQNFLYSSEQNPFATYSKLSKGIENYKRSLSILDGCQFVLSSFASKLFSIGVILTAYEHNEYVGVLNVSSMGYQFEELENLRKLNETSEVFLTWLTGLPYKQE